MKTVKRTVHPLFYGKMRTNMYKKIRVKDSLRHEKYSWPLTLLTYEMEFGRENIRENDWELQDESGKAVEYQVTDVVNENGWIKRLKLHFLCELSSGQEKNYYFVYGNNYDVDEKKDTFECEFDLEIDELKKRFSIECQDKKITFALDFTFVEYREVNKGTIFHEVEILCKGTQGKEYVLNIKRIKGMPFWELKEEMKGFSETEEMKITFEGFDFTKRYSWLRPVEKIDMYLTQDYKIPVIIMPYENWDPWFQSKYITFLGEEQSAGLFIRDNLEWDDLSYPIWGANREFGVSFTYKNEVLEGHFPLKNGKRFVGMTIYEGNDPFYIEYLWLWYAFLHLDKTKNWILEWQEDKKEYPRFFDKEIRKTLKYEMKFCEKGKDILPGKMGEIVRELSPSMNAINRLNPVDNREFDDWTVIFDITADQMTQKEFDSAKAAFAFMAYAAMDENYMPTENMLAGHPNFLCDTAAVSGFFSALFPNHPECVRFRDYFCKVIRLNLKYHIRPDVAVYQSLGGRATENLGCYNFAALRPTIRVCSLFDKCGYEIPLNCAQGEKWLKWLTNCLTAPVDGRRLFPPQGAHSAKYADGYLEIPYMFYQFAQLLRKDYPETAQNAIAACEGSCLDSLEYRVREEDVWRNMFHREDTDLELKLESEKFTGYGYILRNKVGTEDEISVHVQQLDEGPNYRWGTFRNTGNGGIHYYACKKRYSYNCVEDTGDRNLGAEEGNCSFSVLKGHTYYNIGFHDLTEDFLDFSMIKQVKLLSDNLISQYYKFRKVSLVESDYIVIYDAVTHMRARGRFTWTVNELDSFPKIFQLKPGASAEKYRTKGAVDRLGDDGLTNDNPCFRSKTIGFDGDGDFLTIVSHRSQIEAKVTDYGAKVILPERIDFVFEDSGKIRFKNENFCFYGKSGIFSVYHNGMVKGAVLDGNKISYEDLSIEMDGRCAVSFESTEHGWKGMIIASEELNVVINGENRIVKKGSYDWSSEEKYTINRRKNRIYEKNSEFIRDTRKHEFGFYGTDFCEKGRILSYPTLMEAEGGMDMNIRELREKFDQEMAAKGVTGNILKFEGVDGYDVYNTSHPFSYEGKEYMFGRVERRDEWARSVVCLFSKKAEDVWELVKKAMIYQLEDPFITELNGEIVLGGTRVNYSKGMLSGFCGVFYKGKDLFDLHYYTTGPEDMKDIRLVKLADGRLGVFSRPRGEEVKQVYGSEAVIGFTVLNGIEELDDEALAQAPIINGLFDKDEWGGCNQCLLLEDGRIGVIGHRCYYDFDGKVNQQVYVNIAFVFDPETFKVSDMKVIGTRKSYPQAAAKKEDLADCAFTSGIVRRPDGRFDLYSGIGDTAEGRIVIDNPFAANLE